MPKISKVLIYPSQSLTNAYLAQLDDKIVAMCSSCTQDITQTAHGADGLPYWQCEFCGHLFDHDKDIPHVTRKVELSKLYPALTRQGITYERWVEIWTGLTVKVDIT